MEHLTPLSARTALIACSVWCMSAAAPSAFAGDAKPPAAPTSNVHETRQEAPAAGHHCFDNPRIPLRRAATPRASSRRPVRQPADPVAPAR